jgi:RHS repeat-associated protein
VLSTISDKKVGVSAGGVTVDYYNAEVLNQNDYYAFGMMMPGRKYSIANTNYRFGFNGQEKSTEINSSGNLYTAQFWEYDSRIGRRWNRDPKTNTSLSPYSTFANNPIFNSDPLGDTTIPTVNGGTMELTPNSFTTFDGKVKNLKGSSVTVRPDAGTLNTFTAGTEKNPLTFEARFGSSSGKFLGYFNSDNPSQSFDDYYNGQIDRAHAMDVVDGLVKDGVWDRNVSDGQAKWRTIGLGLGTTLPNVFIKPLSIATATQRVANSGGKAVADFIKLFKPINELDVTTTLYRGTTGSEKTSSIIFLTNDAKVAATYVKQGGQVMQYEMSQFSVKSLITTGELELKTGINGINGAVSTEYMFKGKKLVEAVNSIAEPLK